MHLAYNQYVHFLATSIIDKFCVNKPDILNRHGFNRHLRVI